jgi:hypothetical protein
LRKFAPSKILAIGLLLVAVELTQNNDLPNRLYIKQLDWGQNA